MSSSRLNGKAALVTGGSRGIGAAIARRLAADGASVALTYVHGEEQARAVVAEIEAKGGRAIAIKADNRDAVALDKAVDDAVTAFGRLDILVNSAGIWRAAPIDTLSLADFDETMEVNLRAPFIASKAAAAHMGEGGSIISIGSNLAERADGSLTAYSASKAALVGLTKALARDLGPRGITANVVHPGSTDTDMNPADGPHAEHQRRKMATPRFGKADDIAGMVAWLAGPEGRFVTGAALTIDGGANA
ncbi:3-oxoacyl-ACP reductase FabG [Mesorhizobium sp. M7A.F.Ca.CA.002.10.1.1]|uniref:SDR family NAD(P)-dependent oxidoreductase n=5 Tax=Phyllobacteriaceae TaxID=69277 RepID=UPI0007A94986|nr:MULTISPECIES: 3-oxoacyl-ACP reductase family protein [Mesorhizobium]AMX92946.1 oxidoreductase [Mesorhizobium ciceri]MDF3211542.1 3-oxoacyl-ACP reductase FabG [Mesorhizobium sp. LMG15046]MDF3233104.1 3-oxoacyl-ACP reductase FabG [Mesorhizobium sp. DSM 30133]RUU17703.1 3-oxoacyl-ACP reductase FabG [Mesorhizobium sp. Primo-B]RUU40284.1 3-oxoacyl-ACP reductase FabG [Mesorhizobium sp. Primo-A]